MRFLAFSFRLKLSNTTFFKNEIKLILSMTWVPSLRIESRLTLIRNWMSTKILIVLRYWLEVTTNDKQHCEQPHSVAYILCELYLLSVLAFSRFAVFSCIIKLTKEKACSRYRKLKRERKTIGRKRKKIRLLPSCSDVKARLSRTSSSSKTWSNVVKEWGSSVWNLKKYILFQVIHST